MPETPTTTSKYLFWTLNTLLGAAFIADIVLPHSSEIADALLIIIAALATVVALKRQLPWQNVLPVVLVAALAGGLAHGLSANPNLSLPFGPLIFNPAAGDKIFDFVPWTIPFLWVIAILNSRGTARLILRPWRKTKTYGFWLIGLTAVMIVMFDLALEPFACSVRHYWRWQHTKIALTWHGATPLNFIGWACVTLLVMAFVTPVLIRKQPGGSGGPEFQSSAIWLGALVLFGIGAARTGLWWAAGADAIMGITTVIFAVRGARW